MTSQSLPADNSHPSWQWLQRRLETKASDQFADWLTSELDVLEDRFSHLVTPKSRARQLRSKAKPADAR